MGYHLKAVWSCFWGADCCCPALGSRWAWAPVSSLPYHSFIQPIFKCLHYSNELCVLLCGALLGCDSSGGSGLLELRVQWCGQAVLQPCRCLSDCKQIRRDGKEPNASGALVGETAQRKDTGALAGWAVSGSQAGLWKQGQRRPRRASIVRPWSPGHSFRALKTIHFRNSSLPG